MATKFGKLGTYGRKTPHIKSRDILITWSNVKPYIWTSAITMTTKLVREVTCGDMASSSRSGDILITLVT